MSVIIGKIVIIFVMIGIGFILVKKKVIPATVNQYLIKLLLVVTTPCMILQSLASNQLTEKTFDMTIEVLLGSVIYFVVIILFSYLIVKLFKNPDSNNNSVYMVLMTSVNTGFMGFPITKSFFGNELFYLMVIENVILTFYLYTIMPIQLNIGQRKKTPIKEVIKSVFNLCTISAFAGVIMLFSDLSFPAIIDDGLKTIGDATIPLSMIVVGIELGNSNFKEVIKNKYLTLVNIIAMVIIPILTFFSVNWLPLYTETKVILIFASAFPAAVVTVAISAKEKKNAKLAAEGVALTTLTSLITLTIFAMLLMGYYL